MARCQATHSRMKGPSFFIVVTIAVRFPTVRSARMALAGARTGFQPIASASASRPGSSISEVLGASSAEDRPGTRTAIARQNGTISPGSGFT